MDYENIIIDMVDNIPRSRWGNHLERLNLNSRDIQELASEASSLCAITGELSEYFEWRGAAGCGDHGHDDALKKAQKRRKKVRKALGYSYP